MGPRDWFKRVDTSVLFTKASNESSEVDVFRGRCTLCSNVWFEPGS